jgi:hypothetical protein
VTISATECVAALLLAGFRVLESRVGGVMLRGPRRRTGTSGHKPPQVADEARTRVVVVPDAVVLPEEVLDALLDDADLSHEKFLWLLSEAPTQPD